MGFQISNALMAELRQHLPVWQGRIYSVPGSSDGAEVASSGGFRNPILLMSKVHNQGVASQVLMGNECEDEQV